MIEAASIYLERHDPSSNMARFYALDVETDLFGTIVAVRRWGRIGTRGRSLSTVCGSVGEALQIAAARACAKRRRGYCDLAPDPRSSSPEQACKTS